MSDIIIKIKRRAFVQQQTEIKMLNLLAPITDRPTILHEKLINDDAGKLINEFFKVFSIHATVLYFTPPKI